MPLHKRLCATRPHTNDSGDIDYDRGHWTRPVEYILSIIGYSVGMGSLYRFPYLVMRNGGGAFLIAFVFFMITCGFPLFFMESALGQYYQLSPIELFNICPLFKGIGYAMVALSTLVTIYYMTVLAWVFHYLYSSFSATLPWTTCSNAWNTNSCIPLHEWNVSETHANISAIKGSGSTEQFWERGVLGLSSGIEELGAIQPTLAICLLISWALVFICICKGIATSRIAVYLTATTPFLFLIMLLVRGSLLPGSLTGILYYISPRWDRIIDPLMWLEAFLAVFYSLGPAWGGVITLASYNPRNQNCFRDAIIVTVVDTFTAFICGFVVFSVLGYMAEEAGVEIADVVNVGPGLAFVTYPNVVATLPIPHFWAAVFFLLILFLGIDSQFGMIKTLTSGLFDKFPTKLGNNKAMVTLAICSCGYLIGLLFVTEGGMYMFQIVDWYCSVVTLIAVSFLECVVITWIYGGDRFINEIHQILPNIHRHVLTTMKYIWKFIIPPIMLAAMIFTCVRFKPPMLGDYTYPTWTEGLGWTIALSSFIPLPIVAVYKICRSKGTLKMRILYLLKSSLAQPKVLDDDGINMTSFEASEKLMNGFKA